MRRLAYLTPFPGAVPAGSPPAFERRRVDNHAATVFRKFEACRDAFQWEWLRAYGHLPESEIPAALARALRDPLPPPVRNAARRLAKAQDNLTRALKAADGAP